MYNTFIFKFGFRIFYCNNINVMLMNDMLYYDFFPHTLIEFLDKQNAERCQISEPVMITGVMT